MYLKVPYGADCICHVFLIQIFEYRKIKASLKPWRIYFPDKIIHILPASYEWCMVLQSHNHTKLLSYYCSFFKALFHKIIPVKPCCERILALKGIKLVTPCQFICSYAFMNRYTRPCCKKPDHFCTEIFGKSGRFSYHEQLTFAMFRYRARKVIVCGNTGNFKSIFSK